MGHLPAHAGSPVGTHRFLLCWETELKRQFECEKESMRLVQLIDEVMRAVGVTTRISLVERHCARYTPSIQLDLRSLAALLGSARPLSLPFDLPAALLQNAFHQLFLFLSIRQVKLQVPVEKKEPLCRGHKSAQGSIQLR